MKPIGSAPSYYTHYHNKVVAACTGAATAVFIAALITCFVLINVKQAANPERVCNMTPGPCYDILRDGVVLAGFKVNIIVAGCDNVETVEMWNTKDNCLRVNSHRERGLKLTDGCDSYYMGGVACYTRATTGAEACTWDHGDFMRETITPLLLTGVFMSTCAAATFITMLVFLCFVCDGRNKIAS
ncbi:hypothetical protein PRJ_Dakar_00022 [Faustovirus]|nr:hypothetical protein PRJ_Dakar_00022 [Faustovirus]